MIQSWWTSVNLYWPSLSTDCCGAEMGTCRRKPGALAPSLLSQLARVETLEASWDLWISMDVRWDKSLLSAWSSSGNTFQRAEHMKSCLQGNPHGPLHASSLTSILRCGPLNFNHLHPNTLPTHFFVFYSLKRPFAQTGKDKHFVKALMKGRHVCDEQAVPAADKRPVLGLFLEQLTYYLMQGLVWMRAGPPGKWITCPSLLLKLSIILRPKWSIMSSSSKTQPSKAASVWMLMLDVWKRDFSYNSENVYLKFMTWGPSKLHQLYPSHTFINNTDLQFLKPVGQPSVLLVFFLFFFFPGVWNTSRARFHSEISDSVCTY